MLNKSQRVKADYYESHKTKFISKAFETKSIHMGQPADFFHGSVNTPIHMTTTYAQSDCGEPFYEHMYGRESNPTKEALENCIASLENGNYGLVASS